MINYVEPLLVMRKILLYLINGRTIDTHKTSIIDNTDDTGLESIYNSNHKPTGERIEKLTRVPRDISLKKMLTELLSHLIDNEITAEDSEDIHLVIFSDKKLLLKVVDYYAMYEKYKLSGYHLPKITVWDLNGKIITSKYESPFIQMNGFEPYIINYFLNLDDLTPEYIPYHKVSNFISIVDL